MLIDPERRSLEIFRRLPSNDWLLATGDSARALVLASLETEIGLDEVFEDVVAAGGGPDDAAAQN